MTGELLRVQGLSKSFPSGDNRIPVLADISLALAAGESLALMGRSGSGKSTLLNLLCGLEAPDAGQICVAGQLIDSGDSAGRSKVERLWADLRRQTIGVVFQDANLMPALSLLDNVRLRARLAGQDDCHCENWLERLGIGHLARRYPDQVSGGQSNELFRLQAETGCGLILATHDPELAKRCDLCLDLAQGAS